MSEPEILAYRLPGPNRWSTSAWLRQASGFQE
jgi:hypothetical protein